MSNEVRQAWRTAGTALAWCFWLMQTMWLGAAMLWRLGRVARSSALLSETLHCERGHPVPAYGLWKCSACGALMESHVFSPCSLCGAKPTYTPCPECGLPVVDPLA